MYATFLFGCWHRLHYGVDDEALEELLEDPIQGCDLLSALLVDDLASAEDEGSSKGFDLKQEITPQRRQRLGVVGVVTSEVLTLLVLHKLRVTQFFEFVVPEETTDVGFVGLRDVDVPDCTRELIFVAHDVGDQLLQRRICTTMCEYGAHTLHLTRTPLLEGDLVRMTRTFVPQLLLPVPLLLGSARSPFPAS